MQTKELAEQIKHLDDENFCIVIKKLDSSQLKELQASVPIEKVIRIGQELSIRKSTEIDKNSVKKSIPILKLEQTAEQIAPTPNLILRSSLFNASKTHGAQDNAVRDFEIATYGGKSTISLTAFRQFNQSDLDLLLELIKLQQEQNTVFIKLTARQLTLKSRQADNLQSYIAMKEQLELFQNASIKIKYNNYEFIGSFLNSAYFDNKEQLYVIKFNEELQYLFVGNNWSSIDTNIRKQLKSNLAKWLHGFYSSHVNSTIPIKLETIYQLSGSKDKDKAQWKRVSLNKALINLQSVFNLNSKKFVFKIKKEYLHINKCQSISQNKSVKNKIINNKKSSIKK